MHSEGVMTKSPSPSAAFVWISDKDMTEIELHSVDSISDLHRTNMEHHSKGIRPPRPQPPTINGHIQMTDRPVVCQTARPEKIYHLNHFSNICTSSRWCYSLICMAVILILLTLILIFSFLVQQSSALHRLSEILKQNQEGTEEIFSLMKQLQALHLNLTAPKTGH
ncbi:uncharacterized protein si:dkey-20d21.12 [Trichomycterus rosablanca]|uniref:uncharacterized protein si:dkey-20d21.12 n=1 Tax=Trichomycterus rosablanca TaxID=2290929 RepID=UPI002F34F6CF